MPDVSTTSACLPFGAGPEHAPSRLFCLPFAGGGASNFFGWRHAGASVAVVPVQYPGHETRIDEPPQTDLNALLDHLSEALLPWLERPYALFGYSLGARIAFSLIRRLERLGAPEPFCLVVAASAPPNRKSGVEHTVGLPDAEIKQLLRLYGGMPEELLEDDAFCEMMLPVIRADFALSGQPLDLRPVRCPILAYAGQEDRTVSPEAMSDWRTFTQSDFRLRTFVGGHFFMRQVPAFAPSLLDDLHRLREASTSAFHTVST